MNARKLNLFATLFCLIALIASLLCGLFLIYRAEPLAANAAENFESYRSALAELNARYAGKEDSRIIVKSKKPIKDENAIASATGFAGLNVFQYSSHEEAQRALERYSALNHVVYSQFDEEMQMEDDNLQGIDSPDQIRTMSVSEGHLSWGADLLGVDAFQKKILKKYGDRLPAVYVAVLDSGIDTDHEFLQDRIAYDLGTSFVDSEKYLSGESEYPFEDDRFHGTHVSGTIVDLTLSNVQIIPIKVINKNDHALNSDIISGLEYVLDLKKQGSNIVACNMSLGGFGTDVSRDEIINSAYEENIMSVVAAMNNSADVAYYTPANCEKALTISALGHSSVYSNFLGMSYFSNFGSCIDLCLPGSGIVSSWTDGGYGSASGTSMATPHAAALVALYATYYGSDYSAAKVEQEIKENTYDWGEPGRDDLYGYGIPNMAFASEDGRLEKVPTLSAGMVNSTHHFYSSSLDIEIENNNVPVQDAVYKICYTLDGSYPTLLSDEYTGPIRLNDSALLRFAIYLLDEDGGVKGHSELYEATYFKGDSEVNDSGVGFEISPDGVLLRYTSGLRDIVIPDYVNGIRVMELGGNLFDGLNIRSVKSGAKSMGDYTFYNCRELEEVWLKNIEHIGLYAFDGCTALKTVTLSDKIEEIPSGYFGEGVFKNCVNLENVNGGNLRKIGNCAFYNCRQLSTVDLTNCNAIGQYAFYNSGLNKLDLSNLESIGEGAFGECQNLRYCILGSNEYMISTSVEWCSYWTTFFLLIDKNYTGETGAFITKYYHQSYVFDRYEYKILSCANIATATFRFRDGPIIEKQYYATISSDGVNFPKQYVTPDHHVYTFTSWICQSDGRIVRQEDRLNVWSDEVFIANEYSEEYAEDHIPSDWIVTKEATCTQPGSRQQKCTLCGAVIETEEIPPKGHDMVERREISPTCTAAGQVYHWHCNSCGLNYEDQNGDKPIENVTISPKGHDFGVWHLKNVPTNTQAGEEERKCVICGAVENRSVTELTPTARFEAEVYAITEKLPSLSSEDLFEAIKRAAQIWNTLGEQEREDLQAPYKTLKSVIDRYNTSMEELNEVYSSAVETAILATVAASIAFSSLSALWFVGKRHF